MSSYRGSLLVFSLLHGLVDCQLYGNATTSFSSIYGPVLAAISYSWSQYIIPTTIGTVEIVINTDTNRTYTTTKTNLEFFTNGSMSILSPQTTNAAGTVTGVGRDMYGSNITVAYPTPIVAYTSDLTWKAILPTVFNSSTCCHHTSTHAITPTHMPFAAPIGSTNSEDPSGWLYTLVGVDYSNPNIVLPPENVSSLWEGASIGINYNGCAYTICNTTTTTVKGASAVSSQAFLFATSTVTTSGSDLSSIEAGAPTTQEKPTTTSSVEVDPIEPTPPNTSKQTTSKQTTSSPVDQTADDDPITAAPKTTISALPQTTSDEIPTETSSDIEETSSPSPPEPTTPQGSVKQPSNSPQPGSSTPSDDQTSNPDSSPSQVPSQQNTANTARPDATTAPEEPSASDALSVLLPALSSQQPTETQNDPENPTSAGDVVPATSQEAPIVIGSATVKVDQSSNYVFSDQTIAPGSTITLGSGSSTTVIALQTSGSETYLVVDSSTSLVNAAAVSTRATLAPAFTLGSSTITPNSASEYVIGSQTLRPGDSTIIVGAGSSTTAIALQTSGSQTYLVVGDSTSVLSAPVVPTPTDLPADLTLGLSTITPNSASEYVIGSQTLSPGGPTIIIGTGSSTTAVALQTSGSQTYLVVGDSTSALSAAIAPTPTTLLPDLTVGSSTITPNSASEYIIGSQTLVPGGSTITVGTGSSRTIVALQTSGSQTYLVIDASTSTLSAATTAPAGTTLPPDFIFGSSTITPNSASEYVIGSQTLTPGGPAITVSGSVISLASGATNLVVGTSTGVATVESGLGEFVWSGIGGEGSATEAPTSSSEPLVPSPSSDAGGGGTTAVDAGATQTAGGSSGAARVAETAWLCLAVLLLMCTLII